MTQLPERRILLRWGFLGIGYLLLLGHDFAVRYLLLTEFWGALLFGPSSAMYAFAMGLSYLFLIPASLLCLATGWGLKRDARWARWTGVVVCAMFLLSPPIMTFLGAWGIYGLITIWRPNPASQPAVEKAVRQAARRSKDYWTAKAQSKLQPVIMAIFTIAGFHLTALMGTWALHVGMPWVRHRGIEGWLWLSGFILFQVAVHEAGHALAAWALYYRVRVISMGPLTISRDSRGFHFQFNWAMLFLGGGYTGASPTSDVNLRLKEIAVVGAGPAASLLNGLAFLAIFFLLPGTAWQSWWWIAAYNAMLGIVLGVSNLMPVGYSDGSMLFHLILGTEPGRALLARHRAETLLEEATELHERAEYEKEIELKRQILERVIEAGESNAMATAICRQTLGHAYLAAQDWPAAEAEFRLCLEQETECAVNPGLAANVHSGLVWTSSRRQHPAETGRAYAAALAAIRPIWRRDRQLQEGRHALRFQGEVGAW